MLYLRVSGVILLSSYLMLQSQTQRLGTKIIKQLTFKSTRWRDVYSKVGQHSKCVTLARICGSKVRKKSHKIYHDAKYIAREESMIDCFMFSSSLLVLVANY